MHPLTRWIFCKIWGPPGSSMSEEDRAISEQIRKLKTLRVIDGHISIDPAEVVTEQFIRERKAAANLLSK